MTFERLMVRKYGVHTFRTGSCTGGELEDCYSSISIPVIEEKFGADVFEKTMREADSLDRIGLGDRETYYAGSWKKFKKLIYREFDSKILKQFGPKDDYPCPTLTLHVDETGKIYDCSFRFCDNQTVIDEVNRIIPNLPQMVFATNDGKAVKDSIIFGLPIHRRAKWKN